MASDLEGSFDVVILGTGLTESIIAAALSKAGYKVAHLDTNSYYGGNEATLSQDELVSWGDAVNKGKHPRFSNFSGTTEALPYSRQYSICLRPAVITALGPLVGSLIGAGVAKYSGFRLLDSVSIYSSDGTVKGVPGSKEDIFTNKDISLIEKRRLMRFLTFAAGDFEEKPELKGKEEVPFIDFLKSTFTLSESIASVIAYSLAHCTAADEPTLTSLLRMRHYVRSIGRYGPSPFLVGHYGGIGDISQGFCRASAVNGGVYILGRPIIGATFDPSANADYPFTFTLDDFPEPLHAKLVLSTDESKPSSLAVPLNYVKPAEQLPAPPDRIARGVVVIDKPVHFRSPASSAAPEGEDATDSPHPTRVPADASLLVFPPSSVEGGSVSHAATVHITGEDALSAPKGKWILYFVLPLSADAPESAESMILPYVNALLSLPSNGHESAIEPLATAFFLEHVGAVSSPEEHPTTTELPRHLIVPPLNYSTFPDLPDAATRNAEAVFRCAVQTLHTLAGKEYLEEEIDFWPPIETNNEEDSDDE
ncbi:rab escort protein [Coprinopsis sp. MPI-PUGE-AT-0042]|nr:rab escort protein [Coprinopsis sp. MPI-PUGE-AT-0042]